MLQNSQKRQTFRLSIRNRQIQQKFNQIRRQYQKLQQKQIINNIYNTRIQLNHEQLTLEEIEQKNRLKNIVQQLLFNLINRNKNKNKNIKLWESMNINLNSMYDKIKKQPSYRNIFIIAINEILQKNGLVILQSIKNMGQSEDNQSSDGQKQQYVQQLQDQQYRALCDKDNHNLSIVYQQNTHTLSNISDYNTKIDHNITFCIDNYHIDSMEQIECNYHMQLEFFHKGLSIISSLSLQKLPFQSSLHLIQIIWDCYQSLPAPDTKIHIQHNKNQLVIKQKYLHHLYLEIVYKVLTVFYNFITNQDHIQSGNRKQFYKDLFVSIGLYDKLRYIIDYVVQSKVFLITTGQCIDVLTNNFILLNLRIVQLILQYQRISNIYNKQTGENVDNQNVDNQNVDNQNVEKLDLNLHQYFGSYLLYILNQYQSVLVGFLQGQQLQYNGQEIISSIKLYQQTLHALLTVLNSNIQIVGHLQVQKYANLLNVIGSYSSKCSHYHNINHNYQIMYQVQKNQSYECIVFLILNLFQLVTQNCQKSTNQLIAKYKLLHILEQFLTTMYNTINTNTYSLPKMNNPLNQKTIIQFIPKISRILSNLLYTSNKRIKQILYSHSIYERIMDYLTNVNNIYPFIKLIDIFVSYFVSLGSKVTNKYMDRFLEIVSRIDLQDEYRDCVKEVRKIIETVFQNCKCYIKEQQMDRIRNMYAVFRLQQFMQEDQQIQMYL